LLFPSPTQYTKTSCTHDPDSCTLLGGGAIASILDGLLNFQTSIVNVSVLLSGNGIELYGTPDSFAPVSYGGLVGTNAAASISNVRVTISSVQCHDRRGTPNGASLLNLNAATISDVSLLVVNKLYIGVSSGDPSVPCFFGGGGVGVPLVTNVDSHVNLGPLKGRKISTMVKQSA
jgi:hypothetical protein